MASPGGMDEVPALFSLVQEGLNEEDWPAVVSTCNQILEIAPDADAVKCKLYALVQQSQDQQALDLIESVKRSKGKFEEETGALSFTFEKAYALYRLNKFSEAMALVNSPELKTELDRDPDRERAAKHLKAQLHYRLGEYEKAADVYRGLREEQSEEEEEEASALSVQLLAALVSGSNSDSARSLVESALEDGAECGYEILFNSACVHIDLGELETAKELLDRAEDQLRSELEDEMLPSSGAGERNGHGEEEGNGISEADTHPEMLAVTAQKAYVLQKLGQSAEAHALLQKVLQGGKAAESDVTVMAIASNNRVAAKPEGTSLFDSLKRIEIATRDSLEYRMTERQQAAIALNKCIVQLQAGKVEECRQALKAAKQRFPDHPRVCLVEAALLMKERKQAKAEELLRSFVEASGKGKGKQAAGGQRERDEVAMSLAFHKAKHGAFTEAAAILEGIQGRYLGNPNFLAAYVAVLQKAKDTDGAVKVLNEAIAFCKKSGGQKRSTQQEKQNLKDILLSSAELCLKLKRWDDAGAYFKQILDEVDSADPSALCGMVAASALSGKKDEARSFQRKLKLPDDVKRLDATELESRPLPKIQKTKRMQAAKAENAERIAKSLQGRPVGQTGSAEGVPLLQRDKKEEDGGEGSPSAAAASSSSASALASAGVAAEGGEGATALKKKRKKKIRYPKNFDPNNPGPPPDPERWLPKRERAEYKKMMAKRKNLSRGPQGAAVSDGQETGQFKQGPSTAHVHVGGASTEASSNRKKNRGRKK
uniref:Signal recognition particle subunit SRP72 n=1 Tax=Chromera velia CCMP2878 TaxID=1169474 RepID=A0A0G4HTR3_9ALVE|mmetsp:Transcript_32197/g.63865  ORF Transcript_32197/g.63865 Transcript_32197/m.63865 type:complete len:769 (+) Transcript_32197:308-2614(+)|eukprot:Cvel_8503.t1-p1 / transcript=Cvel_8503.t1 / gene=Cvel_8503 / organism=Chromera_velia_CCMP2878 / gene_product=Signal recognition particle subunit SRP72, putative / transcript_product=Signal recognition particle subunit SRP72, putative / location=Cvel_scaffold470:39463-47075(-) / protein_length=768 / sequence_SO=supercontig / SO=protein_coding / is_pseudo=false